MQLQQIKAEDLEQNKLDGVSTNTFSLFIQKNTKKKKKSWGKKVRKPCSVSNNPQSGVAQCHQSLRLPVPAESTGSLKPGIH